MLNHQCIMINVFLKRQIEFEALFIAVLLPYRISRRHRLIDFCTAGDQLLKGYFSAGLVPGLCHCCSGS